MPKSSFHDKFGCFKDEGPLMPEDPAFDGDVYIGERYIDPNFGVDMNEPQVIASPKGTGKTTLAYLMRHQHYEFAYEKEVFIFHLKIPLERNQKISENKFKLYLCDELHATEKSSLISILGTSIKIKRSIGRKVLHIEKTERLEGDAINWLLSGVKELIDNQLERNRLMVHVILDGCVELHSLTAGRNSKFPLQQIYPLEFNQTKLNRFITTRFDKFEIKPETRALELLWELTQGDKYFTQKICLSIAHFTEIYGNKLINEETVLNLIRKYVSANSSDDHLKESMIEAIFHIEEYYFSLKKTAFPWKEINDLWEDETILNKQQRDIIYEAGLVRRKGVQDIEIRAPIIFPIVDEVKKRVQHVRVIIQNNISITGIPEEEREDAVKIIYYIERAAALGKLTSLHAGTARYISNGILEIEATALNKGSYKGTIEIDFKNSKPIASEFWILIWGVEEPDEFTSKVRYFSMLK